MLHAAPQSLPFVGIAESNTKRFHINAVDVMKPNEPSAPKCDTLFLVESGKVLADALEKFKDIDAFPVVTRPSGDDDDLSGGKGFFCGMISRRGIAELLEKHTMADDNIDLSAKVEVAPLVIPPSMPLPFIYRWAAGRHLLRTCAALCMAAALNAGWLRRHIPFP